MTESEESEPGTLGWNRCTVCGRAIPCRYHPDAPIVGPVPPEELEAAANPDSWEDER